MEPQSESAFPASPVANSLPPPAAAFTPQLTAPSQRDRIVVIGRRQSGKTVYLATLYEQLWRAKDSFTGKALSGQGHRHLMEAFATLRKGEWPSATLGSARVEMELEYHGQKHLMVALDFAGELFAKAFLNDAQQTPEALELISHIDRAAGVILLVDPSVGFGQDHEAVMEEDFGFVQVIERIRNWPGGHLVPIVIALTKTDQHKELIKGAGGPADLIRHHFPAMVRILKQIPIYPVSAVQTDTKTFRPRADFIPVDVDKPLRYCLRIMQETENKKAAEFAQREQRRSEEVHWTQQHRADKKLNAIVIGIVAGVILAGIAIALYILFKK